MLTVLLFWFWVLLMPGSRSECVPGLALASYPLRANSWICCLRSPATRAKTGRTAQVSATQGGTAHTENLRSSRSFLRKQRRKTPLTTKQAKIDEKGPNQRSLAIFWPSFCRFQDASSQGFLRKSATPKPFDFQSKICKNCSISPF